MGGYPFGMSYGMPSNLEYKHKETVSMGYGFGTMGPNNLKKPNNQSIKYL
jgi:hypothetical protein